KHKLQHEVADAVKVLDNFASGVAIFDIDKDGDLDCLTGVRTDYDKKTSTVTYVWLLKGVNGHEAKNISFQVRPGPTPSQFLFRDIYSEESFGIGTYDYTDNKNCVVMEMPYHDSQECLLWVTWKVVDAIPQHCLDHYEDNCDDGKLAYDKDSCGDIVN
ncbi:hypothetical protein MTO96_036747, partial [Rhipicephalus appendiculatus]